MKKSILMITPENIEINKFRKRQFNNFTQITMPYLAGFIDEDKYNIILIDEYNEKIPYDKDFDLVAITVNTPNAVHCYEIARKFKCKGSKIVMGGPHATLISKEVEQHCDYIFVGEAENSWPKFLDDFYNNNAERRYSSLTIPTLEAIPIPRRDLVKKRYFSKGAVFSTRGCPYKCSYCSLKSIYHDSFRTRPVMEVIEDIKSIKSKYFVFWDDNFFADKQYAISMMKELGKLKRRWAAQVTLKECKDEELLKYAQKSGCIYLFVGLESFSAESLISVNKGINKVDEYKSIIELIHKYNICVQAGIIFGFDTDDTSVFKRTLEWCEKIGIDGTTVSILTPLPGTSLYSEMRDSGRLITEDWTYFNGKTRVAFQPKNMSEKELYDGYMWFRKNFYSFKSIFKRLKVSRANVFYNLIINLGYKWSI